MAAKRHRLLTRAYMHGAVQEPGYVFMLEEGELGPHKTVEHGVDTIDLVPGSETNSQHIPGKVRDVPLYEPLGEDEELSPTVARSGNVRVEEQAIAGGTRRFEDANAERATGDARREELDRHGDDVSDAERREREDLHKDAYDPHLGEHDPLHAGRTTSDPDYQGDKPPTSDDQNGPALRPAPKPEDQAERFGEATKGKAVSDPNKRPDAIEARENAKRTEPDLHEIKQPGLDKTEASAAAVNKNRPLAKLVEAERGDDPHDATGFDQE